MAEIENLPKKIIEDGENEGKKIKENAHITSSKIIEKNKELANKIINDAKIIAETVYKEVNEKKISQNEAVKRQEILSKKMGIVENVMKKIIEEIENLPKDTYREYFKRNAKQLNLSEGEFTIGVKEKKIDLSFVKEIFKPVKLIESNEKADFDYGVKIMSPGSLYTLSLLSDLEYRKENVLSIINRELFKEENT